MAKCVECTYRNAIEESRRFPNPATQATMRVLDNRRKLFHPSAHPNKFCTAHGDESSTGTPTGFFKTGHTNPPPYSTTIARALAEQLARASSVPTAKTVFPTSPKRPMKPEIPAELHGKFRKGRVPRTAL